MHIKFCTCGQGVTDRHEAQPRALLTIPVEKVGVRSGGPSLATCT